MSRAKSELLRVARVLKSNGTEGEILIGFREISPEDLNQKGTGVHHIRWTAGSVFY